MNAPAQTSVTERVNRELAELSAEVQCDATLDALFVAYLRAMARFGYFALGPITIDVRLIEDIFERTHAPKTSGGVSPDFTRFSGLLMQEVRRSGRKRIDELHYLLAFMRCNEGLPGRVFSELGARPEAVEGYLKETGGALNEPAERLLTPEEVAEYLRVHVHTVRGWIRTGRLPARRVAGLRALRIRFADVQALLKPLDSED